MPYSHNDGMVKEWIDGPTFGITTDAVEALEALLTEINIESDLPELVRWAQGNVWVCVG